MKVQRQGEHCLSGALKTTASTALDILLNLPSLDIIIILTRTPEIGCGHARRWIRMIQPRMPFTTNSKFFKLEDSAESFSLRLSELLHDTPPEPDVNTQWQHLPTPCTLLLGKRLDIVDSRSQLGSTMRTILVK